MGKGSSLVTAVTVAGMATATVVAGGATAHAAPVPADSTVGDQARSTADRRGDLPVWTRQPDLANRKDGAQPTYTITVDYSQTPDLAPVAAQAQAVLEEWYPRVTAMLPTEGFQPPQAFDVVFDPAFEGVAGVAGTTMHVDPDYLRAHPDDLGLFVHEAVHIAQQYGDNEVPGWLTEGVADYIRYYHYQPDDNPIPGAERTHYTDGYGQAAFLLDHVQRTHDADIVAVVNDAARRDVYDPQLWIDRTGLDTEQLWAEAVAAG